MNVNNEKRKKSPSKNLEYQYKPKKYTLSNKEIISNLIYENKEYINKTIKIFFLSIYNVYLSIYNVFLSIFMFSYYILNIIVLCIMYFLYLIFRNN